MSKVKILLFLQFIIFTAMPALAQVDTGWVRRYNGPGNDNDRASALAVDSSGNVYVTGESYGSETYSDYATIKYNSNGDTLWVRRYNGPANGDDRASALAVNDSGNVYVTGHSSGDGSYFDYATIKYNSKGDTLWVSRYYGPANSDDATSALVVDGSGNVYVTGASYGSGTSSDYATIKYAPNGDSLWVRRYNGPGNGYDFATALTVDDSGNVYLTGRSVGSGTSYDYATLKYAPNGETLWVRRYNGPANGDDEASALIVDDSGNVYVTGNTATIKYSPNGDSSWVRSYGVWGSALALDSSGNVYVTGLGGVANYTTIKCAPDGDSLWVRRYNGLWDVGVGASALALDNSGNVYVTGPADYFCVVECWGYNYTTLKYSPNGDSLWFRIDHGPGGLARATALAVNDSGNVYVSGYSWGGASVDFVTIKYVQYNCIAKPGDATGDGSVFVPDVVSLINFIFRSQRAPSPLCSGDADGNGDVMLADIVYLINFIFKSGPAPVKSLECCL
ncbi:MAG: hypothetical protein RBG1_1C00001G1401 [candidate division Zixibacteria bacterium RBG-1]|nr:MAG: hypothetical protein RBG1_1C00001G1401 [candidate division Zixibacteria bacterium RBG-1]